MNQFAFTGGRKFDDREHLVRTIAHAVATVVNLQRTCDGTLKVHHGCANGLDAVVEGVCRGLGIPAEKFSADWDLLGRSAGPIRNRSMISGCDGLVVFPGGPGTSDCSGAARRRDISNLLPSLLPTEPLV